MTFSLTRRNVRFLTALDITTTTSIRIRRLRREHRPAEAELRASTFQDLPGTREPAAVEAAADRAFETFSLTCLAEAEGQPVLDVSRNRRGLCQKRDGTSRYRSP